MDYGYTQLEGAIGLMPAKLGPDDKTPAYILKRDNFWKVAVASFVLIVGLAGLYFGTNHDLWKTTHELESEVRQKRQTEFAMATKLANLELQLESHLMLENRQGVIAGWYLNQMQDIQNQNKNEFVMSLSKIASQISLTSAQQKGLLQLFVSEMQDFTDVSNRMASELTKKLENEASHARTRLHLLQDEFKSLVASELKKRNNYLHNEYKEIQDYDGDGYPDDEDLHFDDEEQQKQFEERKQEIQSIKARIDQFFSRADLYNKFYFKIDIEKNSELYNEIQLLRDEAQAAEQMDDMEERRKVLHSLKKKIQGLSKELALHKVTPFDPMDQTTLGYLNAIIMNVNWPQSFSTVSSLKGKWDSDRSRPLEILQEIEEAVQSGLPEELLVDETSPLLGLKRIGHLDYLKDNEKGDLLLQEMKIPSP